MKKHAAVAGLLAIIATIAVSVYVSGRNPQAVQTNAAKAPASAGTQTVAAPQAKKVTFSVQPQLGTGQPPAAK